MTPLECKLCPRRCGAVRTEHSGSGLCCSGTNLKIGRAAPHFWEEPPISGTRGSGAVFFSGCSLGCVYCQNYDLARGKIGREVSEDGLRRIFARLIEAGCHNINLVTASHYAPAVARALRAEKLPVPVVWNSGGYESPETLKMLEGLVDIYLPDFKYALSAPAARYSAAPDYPQVARAAIREMFRQTGPYNINDKGLMTRGVIIRHLVLPGNIPNTRAVLRWISRTFLPGDVLLSLMSQYTPCGDIESFPELGRRLSPEEYGKAMALLDEFGIDEGFFQELSSASEEYTPPFDLTGLEDII
ncbi:MAG: radical SAM protein [Oscillospiraceae bacterium]|nr:radical SAM protein [Oscillospiraceae bacterium]